MSESIYLSIFDEWLNSKHTARWQEKLKNYTEADKQKYFDCKPLTFGTAGVRALEGPGPCCLNEFTYRALAISYAQFIKLKRQNNPSPIGKPSKPSVLIAHDHRTYGCQYALIVARTLKEQGIQVYLPPNNEQLATPLLSHYIRHLVLDGGINITASHNPLTYNGFKTYLSSGRQTEKKDEQEIESFYKLHSQNLLLDIERAFIDKEYISLPKDYVQQYLNKLKYHLPKFNYRKRWKIRKINILFNAHKGSSTNITKKLFQQLGFKGFYEYSCAHSQDPQSYLINPEDPNSFEDMKNDKFQYLCAQDPDGDRAAIMERLPDGTWYHFSGNEIGIFLVYCLAVNTNNGFVVRSHVTTTFINKLIDKSKIYHSQIGFKNLSKIVETCVNEQKTLILAFEEAAGALLYPINYEKDGFQLLSSVFSLLDPTTGMSLFQELQNIYKQYGFNISKTIYMNCELSGWDEKIRHKFESFEKENNLVIHKVEKIDGILGFYLDEDNWIKFRASGTEPKLKMYINLYNLEEKKIKYLFENIKKYFQTI